MTLRYEFHQAKSELFANVVRALNASEDSRIDEIVLASGVQKDTLRQWLNGSTRTTKDRTLLKVASAFRLKIPELLRTEPADTEVPIGEPVTLDPHKLKYHGMYWEMVASAARQSVSLRHKVGAVLVTSTGMVSIGWNGMPPGLPNTCESTLVPDVSSPTGYRPKTNPEVLHAERNAIDKMTRQGVPAEGAVLFVTRAPCIECAKTLCTLGLKEIWYDEKHDDMRGVKLLRTMGVPVHQRGQREHVQQSLELNDYNLTRH